MTYPFNPLFYTTNQPNMRARCAQLGRELKRLDPTRHAALAHLVQENIDDLHAVERLFLDALACVDAADEAQMNRDLNEGRY